MMAYNERKHMTFICQRCGASYRDLPFYLTPELEVICFGCLCEVNPTIALEVIRTAMAEQDKAEREIEKENEEREERIKDSCRHCTSKPSLWICSNCGYTC